jgi:hypothetical protein
LRIREGEAPEEVAAESYEDRDDLTEFEELFHASARDRIG